MSPNTNEAIALKAVRDSPGSRESDLEEVVSLESGELSGALYRLRKKGLLVLAEDGAYDLASYGVLRLADSLIPIESKQREVV